MRVRGDGGVFRPWACCALLPIKVEGRGASAADVATAHLGFGGMVFLLRMLALQASAWN